MVKIKGPMLSLAASGTLADAITFASWKGRPYVRERVKPSDPKSGAQLGRRAMFAYLTQQWNLLSDANRATWQAIADELVASPFNAYLSANLEAWHNFLAPSYEDPPLRGDAIGTWDAACAAEWEENRIHLEPELTVIGQNAGILIFASATGTFTTSVGNCILALPATSTGLKHFYWTPPAVATWYFNHRAFSVQGVLGPQRMESSAVP